MRKFLLIILSLIHFGCLQNKKETNNAISSSVTELLPIKPLIVDHSEEEGWGADIRLSIVSDTKTDTTTEYKAISSYQGKNIGLLICIPNGKEGNKGFGEGITLKSIGTESDNLLHTLSTLYKQNVDTTVRFTDIISMNYVNLKEFAESLTGREGEPYTVANEYKLFFEGNDEEEYAELFLNVNTEEHWIEMREKDEEYRPLLIRFLKK